MYNLSVIAFPSETSIFRASSQESFEQQLDTFFGKFKLTSEVIWASEWPNTMADLNTIVGKTSGEYILLWAAHFAIPLAEIANMMAHLQEQSPDFVTLARLHLPLSEPATSPDNELLLVQRRWREAINEKLKTNLLDPFSIRWLGGRDAFVKLAASLTTKKQKVLPLVFGSQLIGAAQGANLRISELKAKNTSQFQNRNRGAAANSHLAQEHKKSNWYNSSVWWQNRWHIIRFLLTTH